MKNAKKIVALLLCAVLLVGATIAGTVAYLTSSDSVENTFTVGNVAITMVETKVDEYGVALTGENAGTTDKNTYKLIPGHTYTKDPTVTVGDTSENCFIFVKIENGLNTNATLNMSTAWAKVNDDNNGTSVWVYGTTNAPTAVAKNGSVTPFDNFTFGNSANPASYKDATIKVTAYAIQATDLGEADTAAEIWALFNA